ncbi:MAG: hypothetical protein IJ700_02910 [Bacteroidaceae bacterium]|nr:hypothetical protein [Bacteroidaceae bacterium]
MDVDHLGSERPTPDPSREGRGEAGAEKEAMPGNMNLLPRELFAKWQKEMPGLFSTSTAQPTPSLAGGMPAGQGGSSILLVYVTPSGRGLKIVFKARPEWGNLIDNQHAMARLLGVEVDESCKDASRMSFICKEEDILFIDKELFTYENKAFAEKYNDKYRSGKSGAEKREAPPAQAQTTSSFRGIPYASIIQTWWQLNGGEPVEGERNVKLYQLAVNLRTICDNKAEVLMKVMPRLGLDEQELRGIVESACKEPPKGISKMLQEVLKRLSPDTTQAQPTPLPDGSGQGVGLPLANWGSELEAMFQHFPILKDVCQGLKPAQYPAALFVGGGLLMTLMTRCTYHFYHRPREVRRLNSSTLIIGDPASGKSFATRLYDLLAAPIIEADQAGKDAVNAYRDLMRSKGANKDKPKKPQVVIRDHPARTSNAQFIQDMVNSVEEVDGEKMQLHMFTFDSELDNTLRLQRGGSWIDKESMELKAFHNEVDGQAYSNSDSVIQNFKVYWNYIYTGTPLALKRKVNSQNFGSGLATRLSVIPLPATRFEMIGREQDEDMGSDQRLSEWARKLDRTKGELPLQKIVDRLYEWTARRMADAEENDSQADEMLLKRCAYHGVNFAAPFIVMRHWKAIHKDGNYYCCGTFETDEVDWQLAELIVNIQYACQRHFFGHLAEEYFEAQQMEASANVRHQQKTIRAFEQLPREFTAEDVMRCFHLKSHSTASTRICRLVEDRVVKKVSEYVENGTTKARYQKTGVILN